MTDQMDDRQFVESIKANRDGRWPFNDLQKLSALAGRQWTPVAANIPLVLITCDLALALLDLKAAQERIAELQRQRTELLQGWHIAEERIAELEGIVTGLGAVCDERMDNLNAVHKRAEAAEAGLKAAQKNQEFTERRLSIARNAITELDDALKAAERERDEANKQRDQGDLIIDAATKRAELAESGMKAAQEKLDAMTADRDAQYVRNGEIALLHLNLKAEQEKVAELEAEKTPLYSDRIANLERERDALQAGVDAVMKLEVTGPSPIGPLHGAGISDGFDCAKNTMNAAIEARRKQG